ncbi:MAG: beta-hydroxyacyl-ACP dehydratase [Planctomycetota bacterium]|nr:beta-hydroxyacyl-ACP dehydratase [Planctomycetota bacterium]
MWIDRIVELVPRQRLVAIKHVSLAEEHLHDHFSATATRAALPIMPAALIVEGMAQTAGILVGHAEGFREKVILAKVSKAELLFDAVPGDTLRYTATIIQMDRQGASTQGVVELLRPTASGHAEPIRFGTIDLMFSHIDQNMSGTAFPEHNFVFSESFKTLLRTSGIAADFPTHA